MWRGVIALVVVAVVVGGLSMTGGGEVRDVGANAVMVGVRAETDGYARAVDAWDWQFPRDHGPHPDFQTEWWYYTGNVKTADGRHFGYQFTIFRRAVRPTDAGGSEWRSNQIYMAHFTVSDVQAQAFYHDERYSRGGADLAGATATPRYRVWLEDWQAFAVNDDATETRITADAGAFAVDVTLTQRKAPALQGDNGLSAKSAEIGNASYYYSMTRLATVGTIRIGAETFNVSGHTWMDHEFSTSALGGTARGWDWFGLIFDDGRELMIGKIRLTDGGREMAFGGLLVEADGSTRYLPAETFTITATGTWTSPHTQAIYPSGWTVALDLGAGQALNLTLTPLQLDQELYSGAIAYWEGAVSISGDATGYGYAELTGYVDALTGRF
jgi:predicted secreted hydrolase